MNIFTKRRLRPYRECRNDSRVAAARAIANEVLVKSVESVIDRGSIAGLRHKRDVRISHDESPSGIYHFANGSGFCGAQGSAI
jgi:hypothetical protein